MRLRGRCLYAGCRCLKYVPLTTGRSRSIGTLGGAGVNRAGLPCQHYSLIARSSVSGAVYRGTFERNHMNDGYFPIAFLHRDDLEELGFDTSAVDDAMMELIARGLEDVYVENWFWDGVEILADDLKIKRNDSPSYEQNDHNSRAE
jgi:hypothetical protein